MFIRKIYFTVKKKENKCKLTRERAMQKLAHLNEKKSIRVLLITAIMSKFCTHKHTHTQGSCVNVEWHIDDI